MSGMHVTVLPWVQLSLVYPNLSIRFTVKAFRFRTINFKIERSVNISCITSSNVLRGLKRCRKTLDNTKTTVLCCNIPHRISAIISTVLYLCLGCSDPYACNGDCAVIISTQITQAHCVDKFMQNQHARTHTLTLTLERPLP